MDVPKISVDIEDGDTNKIYTILVTVEEAKRLETGKFIINIYIIQNLYYVLI